MDTRKRHRRMTGAHLRSLLLMSLLLLAASPSAFALSENDLREAILQGNGTSSMDLNSDGQVDAADLIWFLTGSTAVARFASSKSTVREGESMLVQVNFDRYVSGTLVYTVAESSTAEPGVDYTALSGTIAVNGDQVEIPIETIEDSVNEGTEVLRLIIAPALNSPPAYLPAAPYEQTIMITDNEARWSGGITGNNLSKGFAIEVIRAGTEYSARLVSDGRNGLPEGSWPVTIQSDALVIEHISVVAYSTLLRTALEHRITLEFESEPDFETGNSMTGSMRYTLAPPANSGRTYPTVEVDGMFILIKEPEIVAVPEPELIDLGLQ